MRCRKAHWYLSAQCDDTLSEKQRRELAAHLKECPSCRREAFYFSEIKGQTARLNKVRARADFNLRMHSRIRAWELEQVERQELPPSLWSQLRKFAVVVGGNLSTWGGVLLGQRRFALVGVVTALLAIVIWTGYDADDGAIPNDASSTSVLAGYALEGYVPSGSAVAASATRDFVVSGVSLVDDTSPLTPPNYVMPTVPAEQVGAQLVF